MALYYNELRLARNLLDRLVEKGVLSSKDDIARSILELTRQLPPDLTLIEYASVKGRWWAWVISAKGVRAIELRQNASILKLRVGRWLKGIQRRVPLGNLKVGSGTLYRTLIAPLGPLEGNWVIVPDGPLKDLPFSALFDGEGLVIEKRAVVVAPSVFAFLAARRRNRDLPITFSHRPVIENLAFDRNSSAGFTEELQRHIPQMEVSEKYVLAKGRWRGRHLPASLSRGVLVAGNPAFDRQEYRDISSLPGTEREARRAAALHGVQTILGDDTTEARFLTEIRRSEVVRFSGHAVSYPVSVKGRWQDWHLPASLSEVVVAGNPAFDRQKYRDLSSLPGAEREARRVAALHGVQALLGDDATEARFLAEARRSEIVQFSGHAVTYLESPGQSALLLADGDLTVQEIRNLHLPCTRLVVLAACGTAEESPRGAIGTESLAEAFLEAGVPGVVASLWDIPDAFTSELIVEFHRQLFEVGDARKALQQAQIHMLRHPDPRFRDPAVWAAFQVYGDASWKPQVLAN